MNLIEIQPPPPAPRAEQLATNFLHTVNSALVRRVEEHRALYTSFWDDPESTPDEILAAMGDKAQLWLGAASESAEHIGRVAAMIGKTLDDFLPAEHYAPRRAFVPGEGGTATMEPPAEGYDAHGNLLPGNPDEEFDEEFDEGSGDFEEGSGDPG